MNTMKITIARWIHAKSSLRCNNVVVIFGKTFNAAACPFLNKWVVVHNTVDVSTGVAAGIVDNSFGIG